MWDLYFVESVIAQILHISVGAVWDEIHTFYADGDGDTRDESRVARRTEGSFQCRVACRHINHNLQMMGDGRTF